MSSVRPPSTNRRTSYYDADQDIYHLSQRSSSENNQSNPRSINNKSTVLSKLDHEITTLHTKLSEAEARIRYHESTQKRAIEVLQSKHMEHVEKIKSKMQQHNRNVKSKLIKAQKKCSKVLVENDALCKEVSHIQTVLAEVTRNKGQTMGEIESLSGRIRVLNENLSESSNALEAERSHSSHVERNLHEVGKQLELISKENVRLRNLQLKEDHSREKIISMHGEQMRALTETLERRTLQLNQSEEKLNEARKQREKALSELETYRSDHHLTKNKKEDMIINLRKNINELKDTIAELKRQNVITNGQVETLNVQLKDKKEEIMELKNYNQQLGKGKLTENEMAQQIKELMNELSSLKLSSNEKLKVNKNMINNLQNELKMNKETLNNQFIKSNELMKNMNSMEEEKKIEIRKNSDLERQISKLTQVVPTIVCLLFLSI
jgi:chromosome segregation ATPase